MARPKQNFKIEIPEKWDDINLELFINIKSLYKEGKQPSYYELISLFSGKDEKYIKDMPALIFEKVVEKLQFLSEPITNDMRNTIDIDGERYIINTEENLKTGEFVDVQMVGENIPAILGILCRKEGEIYDDKFIAEKLDKRIEMFNKQPITKIQPLINFFLTSLQLLQSTTPEFLENLYILANQHLKNIEDSLKTILGKRRYLSWQMRKLQKLKESLKSIYQQH